MKSSHLFFRAILVNTLVIFEILPTSFFGKINNIDSNILQQNDLSITKDLLFGNEKLKDDKNNALLTSTIEFIQSTERFKYPLFES